MLLSRFGDVGADVRFVLKLIQSQLAVVTFVGERFLYLAFLFCLAKIGLRCVDRISNRPRVALVTVISFRCDDDLRFQVDRVLRLVF